tara:strand:- start:271 stop:798 length:528 start_codon:yes stop_codon:yes gene_type:complete
MAYVPKFPEFRISNTPKKNLRYIAVKFYSNRFEELRIANYKLSRVLETKVRGEIWSFYQFNNNDSYKYLVKLYIYSSQFSHCESENNPRTRIYGPYDGLIDEIIKDRDNLKISKYQNSISYESNIYSIINEINNLKLRELKIKCKEMELKISGNKDTLIYSILNKIINFEELISL